MYRRSPHRRAREADTRLSQVQTITRRAEATEERTKQEKVEDSPLYGVAMLKIAMELKKPDAKDLDGILAGVLARMNIPEKDFRTFLFRNGGLLRTLARQRRY
jgi:hypothetical protein